MSVGTAPSLAALALITIVGGVFTFDAYNLSDMLLAAVGGIVGGAAGAGGGWIAATAVSGTPDRLLVAGGGLLLGALLGRLLIPFAGWLAVVLLGFVSTSLATIVVLAGQQFATAVSELNLQRSSPREIESVIEQLAATPALQDQQILLLTGGAGVVGAILASQYYTVIITTGITTIGAALLSAALPLWQQARTGEVSLSESALADLSAPLFLVTLLAGVMFQAYRHREEIGLAGSDEGPDQRSEN